MHASVQTYIHTYNMSKLPDEDVEKYAKSAFFEFGGIPKAKKEQKSCMYCVRV